MTAPHSGSAEPSGEIPSRYDPAASERALYRRWEDAGVYTAAASRSDRNGGHHSPFTVVMPPPNVTAVLHAGHALNNTVQDVLTRWRRMAGDEALWLPGTDHAGIATQNVVEKLIARDEGKTRFDLGREAFVRRTEQFVEETGGEIFDQLKALGASCDWSRAKYTLSPELTVAVREAFVRLYERGFIYKGHRVIHWCPRCLTSLSDEEAEFADEQGALYHISYPLADDDLRTITVATTRPETMLGDVAVAVHPSDERYHALVGKMLRLPLNDMLIPVIADEYTDPSFGSGAVKITPAHDANDFEVGKRHGLAMPMVIDPEGMMGEGSDAAGRVPEDLRGRDRFEAREVIVARLRELKRLEKVQPHAHAVRHCYRCDTVVEPRLSDQWFVKMAPLAGPALEAVRAGRIRILPERWEAVYVNWLENIRDWNISRQLWWGHRIPVFYCENGHTSVSRADIDTCDECGGTVRQDEDVLDTWFSSWLWPLSTLGWPDEQAPDLKAFYPTDMLVTAPEILFFWVARMIMAGYAFMGEAPFHTVYLHGTARDTQHRKMSKSLGNGIDPLDVVRLYGADALRWTLIAGMGMGADVVLDHNDLDKSFATGRNFATKLWNIGRFLLTNVGTDPVRPVAEIGPDQLTRADRWILDKLDQAVRDCDAALGPARPASGSWAERERTAGLRLNEYAEAARRLVWSELADWYLESTKGRLVADADPSPRSGQAPSDREVARVVLTHAFDTALRLLQPIVPFISETLWQRLPGYEASTFLAAAAWPAQRENPLPGGAEFELVRDVVGAVRQLRSDYNLPPGKLVDVLLRPGSGDAATVLREEAAIIGRLTRSTARVVDAAPGEASAQAVLAGGSEVIIPLAGLVDVDKECARVRTELAALDRQLAALRARLATEGFITRAKPEVVEAEREKEREWSGRQEQLARKVAQLCG